ncbi:MAG: polysaccharide export protein [bacterium]|nr:polysaccharide export protein [bacterium]
MRRPPISALILALLGLTISACVQTLRDQPSAAEMDAFAQEARQEYVIGPRDTLAISVWGQSQLSTPSLEVRLDGKISSPLLDDVQAAGLTPAELKVVMTEGLEEFISDPQVTITVLQSRSKVIYILGEVVKENSFLLQPEMRLVDAIAMAGGFLTFSRKDRIKLIRTKDSGQTVEFIFDYDAFVSGENLEQNVLLLPGDRIIVPDEAPFW